VRASGSGIEQNSYFGKPAKLQTFIHCSYGTGSHKVEAYKSPSGNHKVDNATGIVLGAEAKGLTRIVNSHLKSEINPFQSDRECNLICSTDSCAKIITTIYTLSADTEC
jgi:hypothetical protein